MRSYYKITVEILTRRMFLLIFRFSNFQIILLLFFHYSYSQQIDDQTFHLIDGTNQIDYVSDNVDSLTSAIDIDNQSVDNYKYDAIGNLTKDQQEGILEIKWNATKKVKEVSIDDSKPHDGVADRTLQFKYDALGNRIKKIETFITTSSPQLTTYYVYNASGGVSCIYQNAGSGIKKIETNIGLGEDKAAIDLSASLSTTNIYSRTLSQKYYTINDHLGNVRAVITHCKLKI